MRHGLEHPRRDLEQNTIATSNVLEAMRARGVSRIAFSSTGSVYGEPDVFPTPEDAPFPVQTSLYGASKLAGEGLIAAYAAGYGFTGPDLPVRLDPRRALHARPRVRLLLRAEARPDPPARARRRPPGEVLPVRAATASTAILAAVAAPRRRAGRRTSTTSAPTRRSSSTSRSRSSPRTSGVSPEIEHTGGRRGWIGRQPADPPRHDADPRARLGAAR